MKFITLTGYWDGKDYRISIQPKYLKAITGLACSEGCKSVIYYNNDSSEVKETREEIIDMINNVDTPDFNIKPPEFDKVSIHC